MIHKISWALNLKLSGLWFSLKLMEIKKMCTILAILFSFLLLITLGILSSYSQTPSLINILRFRIMKAIYISVKKHNSWVFIALNTAYIHSHNFNHNFNSNKQYIFITRSIYPNSYFLHLIKYQKYVPKKLPKAEYTYYLISFPSHNHFFS